MFEFLGNIRFPVKIYMRWLIQLSKTYHLVSANSLQKKPIAKGTVHCKLKKKKRCFLSPVVRFIHLFVLLFEWPGFASSSNMMELDGTRLVAQSAQKIHLRNHDLLIPAFHRPFCEQFHAGKMIYAKPGWSPHASREKTVPPRNCLSSGLLIVLLFFLGLWAPQALSHLVPLKNLEKAEIS